MAEALLSLVMPQHVAQHVEDLLLSRPDLVRGFTTSQANGHGASVELSEVAELVEGHAPRILIMTVGEEAALRQAVALLQHDLQRANVFFWLTPVVASGRL